MIFLKNERGSTLAITLMILVIFTVLGFGLITLNTSASKQFDNTEQKVQARHYAEMSLLHYKSEALNILDEHNNILKNIKNGSLREEQKIIAINSENNKLCTKLTDPIIVSKINTTDPKHYDISNLTCQTNTEITLATINIMGKGKSFQGKVENIDLDLLVELPGILKIGTGSGSSEGTGSSGNPYPTLPAPPNGGTISNSWPCTNKNCGSHTISNFTDVSKKDGLSAKKADLLFNDSLVMKSLKVEPGNGLNLTVKKDLFVIEKLDVHNHACIAVGGNFTVNTSINSINKLYLYIYGDAYLPSTIDFTSVNNMIYVNGDIYIGGKKINPKPYNSIPEKFSGCGNRQAPKPPVPETPGGSSIPSNLDTKLISTDYRY